MPQGQRYTAVTVSDDYDGAMIPVPKAHTGDEAAT
eukprot:gene19035-33784_t